MRIHSVDYVCELASGSILSTNVVHLMTEIVEESDSSDDVQLEENKPSSHDKCN